MSAYQLVPAYIYTKARELLRQRAVNHFRKDVALVEGFTGDHYLKIEENGHVLCDCKAFEQHGVCSHSVAFVLYLDGRARG